MNEIYYLKKKHVSFKRYLGFLFLINPYTSKSMTSLLTSLNMRNHIFNHFLVISGSIKVKLVRH